MEMIVEQARFNLRNYEYKFYSQEQLIFIAKSNRTIIPSLRKIYLLDNCQKNLCSLMQQNIIRFIISYIPILGFMLGQGCPYVYYSRGRKKGIFVKKYFSDHISGNVENDKYC